MTALTQPVSAFRRTVSVGAVAALWVLVALPLVIPSWQCPTARFTHQPCPGCGMTRACVFFLHGDLGASLRMHPLALPTLLAEAGFMVTTLYFAWRRGAAWAAFEERAGRISLYALMAVMMLDFVLWIVRGVGLLGGPVPI